MPTPDPHYDIAIIGGGVNGAGIARDAAGRGARVLLLEQGDLARGTSSASTKLIHGGLRYLEHYEFALVREALGEREILWRIAPHIVQPLRFVLPYHKGLRPRWILRAGLWLYDTLAARGSFPRARSITLADHASGGALQQEYRYGFTYSDCRVDDARLVILNAKDAAQRGADIRRDCKVTRLERKVDQWRISAGGEQFTSQVLVNAVGPAATKIAGLAGANKTRELRLVRGSHIVVPSLFDHSYAYIFQLPDGRIFFAIPYQRGFTLVGTTDADHQGARSDIAPSPAEIAYLCDAVNLYFRTQISEDDVVWSFAGVRALVDDGSGKAEAASRGYKLDIDGKGEDGNRQAPLMTVYGGKITTYRHLAVEAMARLSAYLPQLSGPDWTGDAPLPGGDFAKAGLPELIASVRAAYPFADPPMAARVARAYGTDALTVLGEPDSADGWGIHFGHGLYAREVEYMRASEWAISADDILWRRSKLGLRFDAAQRSALEAYLTAS